MRRVTARAAAFGLLAGVLSQAAGQGVAAQRRPAPAAPSTPAPHAAPGQPPHAWLFGVWTGGMFPTPSTLAAEACLSQPVVIFTRDVVLRATLTSELYTQRVVESARTNPGVTEFRFAAASAPVGDVLGMQASPRALGFGCENPDVLHVQKSGENEITFPGCADFPYPLIRCPNR